jgi:hypothetical protein
MKQLRATLIAGLTFAAASPAHSQTTLELGAQVCGQARLGGESDADYAARQSQERVIPNWIWDAFDKMQSGPKEMTFRLVVTGGQRVLFANGDVDAGAAARLDGALKANAPVSEVWFNSPGGNSRVGVQMGDIIRSEMVGTRVPAGYGCASACSTAFLGGVVRKVEPGAAYGVHMYSSQLTDSQARDVSSAFHAASTKDVQDAINDMQWQGAMGAAERTQYVQKMGVSVRWLDIWSKTRPGCMTFLSQKELRSLFVNNVD